MQKLWTLVPLQNLKLNNRFNEQWRTDGLIENNLQFNFNLFSYRCPSANTARPPATEIGDDDEYSFTFNEQKLVYIFRWLHGTLSWEMHFIRLKSDREITEAETDFALIYTHFQLLYFISPTLNTWLCDRQKMTKILVILCNFQICLILKTNKMTIKLIESQLDGLW